MDHIFNHSWVSELKRAGIFATEDTDEWKITNKNISIIMRTLNVYVSQFSQSLRQEIIKHDGSLTYEEFCQTFKREFAKAASLKIQMTDDTDLLRTPAQKIIAMLREIQNSYLASSGDHSVMIEKINYAIEKIGQRTLFDIDYPLMDSLDLALQRRPSMTTGWINEFSNLGLELLKENSLLASLANRERRNSTASDRISMISEAPSLSTLLQVID